MLDLQLATLLLISLHTGIIDCARIQRNANYETAKSYGPWGGNAMHGNVLTTNKLNSYPKAPAEAFFGKGVHTHSFPMRTTRVKYENYILEGPGGVKIDHREYKALQNFQHGHSAAGIDGFAKAENISWTKPIDTYNKELKKADAARGFRSRYTTPVEFFGHSIGKQEFGVLGSTDPHNGWNNPYYTKTYGFNGTSQENKEFDIYKKQFVDNRKLLDSAPQRNPFEVDENKYFANIHKTTNNNVVLKNHNPFLGRVRYRTM